VVKTSYQPFEHGWMLWSSQLGWYTQPVIYVVYADSTYQQFEDHSNPATIATGSTTPAPAGLEEPTMGFGQIWRSQQNVRQSLGWATAPELGGNGRFEMYLYGDMVWTSQTNKTYVFDPASKHVQVFDVSF
jgi:hypothetical protein